MEVLGIVVRQLLGFSLVMWPRYKKIVLTSRWGSPNVSYYSAKFGGHRYWVNVDIMLFFICHVTMWSKAHLASYVEYSDGKLPACQVWWAQVLWKCRYKFFSFATWPRNQKITWLWKVVPHHKLPLCHVLWPQILQKCKNKVLHLTHDHVIKRSLDWVCGVFQW